MSVNNPFIQRALISVSDKAGLLELAQPLQKRGIALLSTGGTHRTLQNAGIPVQEVTEVTNFPEIMDGRVKTLHPQIHGGLLGVRENPAHVAAMLAHHILPIDLLIVNLYPFEKTYQSGSSPEECIENIDIGGPAMIRSAAKNYRNVVVLVDPSDYPLLLEELNQHNGTTSLKWRQYLAEKAFARTSLYDAMIAHYFVSQNATDLKRQQTPQAEEGEEQISPENMEGTEGPFSSFTAPSHYVVGGTLQQKLRYGENPHQQASLYACPFTGEGIAKAHQVQGKELSYNNILDGDAALELIREFAVSPLAAAAIIKHGNPCGVGQAQTLESAYQKAYACDSQAAYGGVVALNRCLDLKTAQNLTQIFTELLLAPEAEPEALSFLSQKKNLRLLLTGALLPPSPKAIDIRSVGGGLLIQSHNSVGIEESKLKVVTRRSPTPQEWEDLLFAFRVAKHVKSNAVIYACQGATLGIGAGQMSRVDSARFGAWKRHRQESFEPMQRADSLSLNANIVPSPCVVASDGFFPFADGLLVVAEAGATAIIQPGGSLRDNEVIAAADSKDLAMVFTFCRHFRH